MKQLVLSVVVACVSLCAMAAGRPTLYKSIESTGAQAVLLDVTASKTLQAELDFVPIAHTGDVNIGTKGNSDSSDWRMFCYSGGVIFDAGSSRIGQKKTLTLGTRFIASFGSDTTTMYMNIYDAATGSLVDSYSSGMGGNVDAKPISVFYSGVKMRLYSLKLYDFKNPGDTERSLVADCVPCAGGVYDYVTDKAYLSASGAESFILGDPALSESTTASYAAGTLTVSSVVSSLPCENATLKVKLTKPDSTSELLTMAENAEPRDEPYTLAIPGLSADSVYGYQLVAVGSDVEASGESHAFFTGEVSLTAGSGADIGQSQNGSFVVSRSDSATDSALEVSYSVGGTSLAGKDYKPLSGKVTIPAGAASATITVEPLFNASSKGDTSLVLTLLGGSCCISPTAGQATITVAESDGGEWTYDPTKKVITHTRGAEFKVESYIDVDGVRKLFVRYYNSIGDGIIDFRRPIVPTAPIDGITSYVIYGFGNDTMYSDNANVTELYLPNTVEKLNSYCFRGLTKATVIEPFIPDSVTSYSNPFANCKSFRGDLRLGCGGEPLSMTGGADSFKREMIASITFGTGAMSVPNQHFYGCTYCTNITFQGDGNVTWNASAFQAWNAYQALIKVPATSSWWANFMATDSTFVPWASVSADKQTAYWAKFDPGKKGNAPLGAVKLGSNAALQYITTFKIATTTKDVTIEGLPVRVGDVSPAYGEHKDVGDAPIAVSAPANATADGIYYVCKGYVVETMGDTGWVNPVTNLNVTSFNYSAVVGQQRIVWLWETTGYAVTPGCTFIEGYDLGSASASGTEVATGYYAIGSAVELMATGKADSPFERWCGADVPEGHEFDNPLTVAADRVKTVYPYFKTKWTLASNKICDGYWKFNVSTSSKNVTLGTGEASTGNSTIWAGGFLDLAKGFTDDSYRLTAVCKDFCYGNKAAVCQSILEMTWPDTLITLGNYCFRSCSNLKKVTPFMPLSVTAYSASLKDCSSLRQDWYIGGLSTNVVSLGEYLGGTGIPAPSVTFGYGVRSIPAQFFYGNNNLKTVKFMGDMPTFVNNNMIQACTTRGKRVYLPKGNATWASITSDSGFVAWNAVSPSVQKEYTDAYPGEPLPLGYGPFMGSTQWICQWKPPSFARPLTIILR